MYSINETVEDLKTRQKHDVMEFIRKRLLFKEIRSQLRHDLNEDDFHKQQHRRFEMSGYEGTTGDCTLHNMAIVNEFADLGIYDYTHYLFLDFYKGGVHLYLKYWGANEDLEVELHGYGTTEIIYAIFEKTIFTNKARRRRI